MNRRERRIAKALNKGGEIAGITTHNVTLLRDATSHLKAGRLHEAELSYRKVLTHDPQHAIALHHLGLVRFKLGYKSEAATLIRASVRSAPGNAKAWLNLAVILSNLGNYEDAMSACDRSLALDDKVAETYKVKGDLFRALGDHPASSDAYAAALSLSPDAALLHVRRAKALQKLGQYADAAIHCERALAIDPNTEGLRELKASIEAHITDAVAPTSVLAEAQALSAQGLTEKAIQNLQSAAEREPNNSLIHFALATLLDNAGRTAEAFASCKTALDLSPNEAAGYAQAGLILRKLDMFEGAITAFLEAIRREPTLLVARHNLAVTYRLLGRYDDARRTFEELLGCDPNLILSRIEYAHLRRMICDWEGLEVDEHECLRQLRSGHEVVPPFVLFGMPATPADQLEAGRRYAQQQGMPRTKRFRHDRKRLGMSGRIKLGYLSSDFNEHATALLLTEILELHDRSRFEVTCYSIGDDDGSERSRRVHSACDRFVELKTFAHDAAALKIFNDGIDILVDLNGFTRNSRPEIASLRPAPVQVNYLGYPATMGGDFMDYFIADGITVPPGAETGFSEKVIRLPGCYQPNDRHRAIAPMTPTRAQVGLPENGFVFCCFNGNWKINSAMFDVWMRLLHAVSGSVLWLIEANEASRRNLRKEAVARGIDPDRLVFAKKMPNEQHLARHALADLFLDCIPCNAHTTASDALWAGLPLLTCTGETFASRVAASLLYAVDLPELATSSLAEYEDLALDLARNRSRLHDMKTHLITKRDKLRLFDSQAYTRDLEAAYLDMATAYSMQP